jgi:pimeloyl-ACP methyl ester carboxylesterase
MKHLLFALVSVMSLVVFGNALWASAEKQTAVSPDGVEIAFSMEGKGEPAIVFVHGWCCDRSYWRDQASEFSKTHMVVAIDLAGHGESGMNRTKWTVESYGQDVVAVVEKLGLKKVILVGHSMGGDIIIEAARRMPDRVLALVGVDTYQDLEREIPEEARSQFLAGFKSDFVTTTKSFVRGMFPAGADSALVEHVANDMASAPPEVGIGTMENLLSYRAAPALEGLKIPVYAINADKFPTNVEAAKRRAYSFEVKYMPGRGHFLMLEDPKGFNRLLAETIKEIEAR